MEDIYIVETKTDLGIAVQKIIAKNDIQAIELAEKNIRESEDFNIVIYGSDII